MFSSGWTFGYCRWTQGALTYSSSHVSSPPRPHSLPSAERDVADEGSAASPKLEYLTLADAKHPHNRPFDWECTYRYISARFAWFAELLGWARYGDSDEIATDVVATLFDYFEDYARVLQPSKRSASGVFTAVVKGCAQEVALQYRPRRRRCCHCLTEICL